jgi:thiol:disulfide interchange protein DsbC
MKNLSIHMAGLPQFARRSLSGYVRLFAKLGAMVATILAASGAFAEADSAKLLAKLKEVRPDLPIEEVYPIDVPGMFGIDLPGGATLYGTADGKYLFSGDLYALGNDLVNVAEGRRKLKRKQLMDAQKIDEMVVFSAVGEMKDYINVFTDVDCTYCRQLHREIADYNAAGIEVRYLAYPRQGLGTLTYTKIVTAWCSNNRAAALTALKAGEDLAAIECEDNPVARQYALGQQIGVSGTPAIVTSTGELLPGYVPAARLAEELGL